jgi:hypothetical protein
VALDSTNVRVALTGAIYVAPVVTAHPANAIASWPAGWIDLGWIGEDGITEGYSDDSSEIKAWQNGTTVRRVISATQATLKFKCIETKPDVLELYHKGGTVTAGGITVYTPTGDERAFGFDVLDGQHHMRIVVPRGEVTERGEITYKNNEPVAYELTVAAYPSSTGVLLVKYSDSADWSS